MPPIRPLPDRLASLLERYEAALAHWLASEEPEAATAEMDWCYAALRLQQRVRWPEGAPLVDELGMRAQDLLFVCAGRGRQSTAAREAQRLHDRAARALAAAIETLEREGAGA